MAFDSSSILACSNCTLRYSAAFFSAEAFAPALLVFSSSSNNFF